MRQVAPRVLDALTIVITPVFFSNEEGIVYSKHGRGATTRLYLVFCLSFESPINCESQVVRVQKKNRVL